MLTQPPAGVGAWAELGNRHLKVKIFILNRNRYTIPVYETGHVHNFFCVIVKPRSTIELAIGGQNLGFLKSFLENFSLPFGFVSASI